MLPAFNKLNQVKQRQMLTIHTHIHTHTHTHFILFSRIGDGIKQCLDTKDGTWHAIGSRWRTSDCMDCSCLDNGEMSCCPAYSTPTMFPSDCMKEFDQKACQFNVFKKGDRSVPCPIYNMEGKC
uniref:Beta-microseminoprotein n=1 Tax=Esox lucius TaxID=8010 RepID=A0AAY5K2C2_ESOLU